MTSMICLGLPLLELPFTPACSGSSLEGVRRVGGGQLLPIESQSGRAEQGHPEVAGL